MKSESIPAAERQRRAFELHLAGVTYEQIASALGYASHSGAHKAVSAYVKQFRTEPTQELIAIESARIDRLWRAIWERALGGDLKALDRAIRLMDRRAKLLALDGAQKLDIELVIRQVAQAEGIDPEEALKEARRIATEYKW